MGLNASNISTVLPYFGSKFQAIKIFKSYIPPDTKELYSPFFGSGAFEIWLANNRDIKIIACDNNELSVNFFNCLKRDKEKLTNTVRGMLDTWNKEQYKFVYSVKCYSPDKYVMAARYHLLLQSSVHGRLNHGVAYSSTKLQRRGPSSSYKNHGYYNWQNRIHTTSFDNITIKKQDYSILIKKAIKKNALMYLDPPYDFPENFYGFSDTRYEEFNHEALYDQIKSYDNFIMSYNNTPYIRDLYKDFEQHFPKWSQGARADKKSNEILILGDKIAKWYKNNVDILAVLGRQ